MIYLKFISRLIRFLKSLLTKTQLSNHKFQNKNQVTNANIILNLLKKKKFMLNPININNDWVLKNTQILGGDELQVFERKELCLQE